MLLLITLLEPLHWKQIYLPKDWQNPILPSGSIQSTFVFNYYTRKSFPQTQMRLCQCVYVMLPVCRKPQSTGWGFTMSSFFVSHFESSLESFGIQSEGVWFWAWLFCDHLGLSKSVESHQVMIIVYETDTRKRYREIFKRSLVPLLTSLFTPYGKAKRESVKESTCVCVSCCSIVVYPQLQCGCLTFIFVT